MIPEASPKLRRSLQGSVPAWFESTSDEPSSVQKLARHLAVLAADPDVDQQLPDIVDPLAEVCPPETLSAAVSRVHARLDDAVGDGLPAGSAGEIRDRLGRITEGLWQASVECERDTYRDVLREVSHDIRSPLNSILFLADGLYSGQSGSLTESQRHQLGVVYSAAASLLNMVNDLLDFARTSVEGVDEPETVTFSLSSVLADVRRLVGPIAEHKGCNLRTAMEVAEPRRGDPQIVSRVLVNLVSNALEAAGEGGEVVVRVGGAESTLRVVVKDDGDDPDIERLKELSSPGNDCSLTRRLTGQTHGLGLVICGRMVRAAGGTLDVVRTSEGWTRFTVVLPFGQG